PLQGLFVAETKVKGGGRISAPTVSGNCSVCGKVMRWINGRRARQQKSNFVTLKESFREKC
ncbi:MAG: hypothetical protein RSC25_03925, partial [Christensenella sp.]